LRLLLALVLAAGAVAPAVAQEGDPRAGRRLAGGRCAVCHGNDGIARQPDAANLAGQPAIYVTNQLNAFRAASGGTSR
jgi:cytochrome c553